MHSPTLATAVRRIRTLTAPLADDLSDLELLKRFVKSGDEPAFESLVSRHGPTVLSVCQRILANGHDAEDAFQATFLVLARRAASIKKSASVGCWLHGVAYRVANKLKGQLARQPRSGSLPDVPAESPNAVSWREVRRVLDEEVNRLPERLRLPVMLCYFEGKTRDEAAEALGWKLTTLRGRLEDGRLRLRARLARRGIELSAALLALSAASDGLTIDNVLMQSTMHTIGGSPPKMIAALAKGVVMSNAMTSANLALGSLVLAIGLGSTLLAFRGQASETPGVGPNPKNAEPPVKAPVEPEKPAKAAEWGDATGDFQLRLRQPAGKVKVGDFPELICDLKFTGKEKRSVHCASDFAAIELDGRWYHCQREGSVEGRMHELAPDRELLACLNVRPDSQWINLRDKPDTDISGIREAVPFHLSTGHHTIRVAYTIAKGVRAISNPVNIDVASDGWGDQSGGVKARLRVAKTKLKPADTFTFDLDLKSTGRKDWSLFPVPYTCEIEVDGQWYTRQIDISYRIKARRLAAGGELVPFVQVTVDREWLRMERPLSATASGRELQVEFVPFKLTPGKHKIRVAFPIEDKKVRPISNAVEIEVAAQALDPAIAALAKSADRIWVVTAPTPERPIPEPEAVLKGSSEPNGLRLFDLRLLPGDDPKKKFIVFIRADEQGKNVPEFKPLEGGQWHVPHSDETVSAIRELLLPNEWGEAKSGLRMGLRLRKQTVSIGQPIVAEIVLHNNGKEEWKVQQHRFNSYDYWPDTHFKVTTPDGKTWELRKQVGAIKESDNPHVIALKPGASYIHAVRLDVWPAHTNWLDTSEPLKNLFTRPGEYSITAHYRYSPPFGVSTWTADFASAPVKLRIETAADWGEPVGGIRARLRLAKTKFQTGEPLVFELDLKNAGLNTLVDAPIPFHCHIEYAGNWYTYTAPVSVVTSDVKIESGKEYVQHVKVTTDKWWQFVPPRTDKGGGTNEAKVLELKPGKHKVRVSYPLSGKDALRVVSQQVEIEVGDPVKKN